MALVYCTECGTQMSDQAYACPKCGHRIPQTVPLQPIPTMSTPWYFTTPAVILGLLFCWPIGLVIMWVGRVWPTWVRATITSIYLLTIGGTFFLWFLSIKVASDQMGQHMQMMIDELQNMPAPPATYYPPEYYEEMERGDYSSYQYEEPAQPITPSVRQTGAQIELGLWTWVNEASPRAIKIEGTVKNSSAAEFEGLKVYITAEDASGMLLGVGSGPMAPSLLPAGGTSSFVVRIMDAQCTTDSLSISCRFEY